MKRLKGKVRKCGSAEVRKCGDKSRKFAQKNADRRLSAFICGFRPPRLRTSALPHLDGGFSLLELLISIFMFLVIIAITFALFTSSLKMSKKELTVAYYDEAIKSAMTLMTAEIEQAGSHPDTPPIAARLKIPANAGNQDVVVGGEPNVNPLRGINIGDRVTIYDDPNSMATSEAANVLSIDPALSSFRANLSKPHPADAAVCSIKQPFRTGVLPNSTGDKLKFFGDIFDDGLLYYVEYTYDRTNQRLMRAARLADGVPAAGPGVKIDFVDRTLMRNVYLNPNSAPLFQYIIDDQNNIVSVIITLTVGTGDFIDQRLITLTSTVNARNVLAVSALLRTRDVTASRLPAVPAWIDFASKQR